MDDQVIPTCILNKWSNVNYGMRKGFIVYVNGILQNENGLARIREQICNMASGQYDYVKLN